MTERQAGDPSGMVVMAGERFLRSARVRVPGSTSNLGSAFDAVGLALEIYLTVEVAALADGPSTLEFRGRDAALGPSAATNWIWSTMVETAERFGRPLPPFPLRVTNEIPITRGLGSSATARVAAVRAAEYLCSVGLGADELLELATLFEGHPDNVAPALLGGLVSSIAAERILWTRLEFPAAWR